MSQPTIFQHPLAYLLGLEGVALMRAYAGEHDRAFTYARFAEVRRLVDRIDEFGSGVELVAMSPADAYAAWAASYDSEDNSCFPMRDDLLGPMMDLLPTGRVLDAACGTGAVAGQLVARGHEVIGVDGCEPMLVIARKAVPDARFVVGDVRDLPLPDVDVDHVVCSLALAHLPELEPFFGEAARVMRPGGHLLVLDTRGHFTGSDRYPLGKRGPDGRVGYLPGCSHGLGDYLRAALANGFVVRACEEGSRTDETVRAGDLPGDPDTELPDIWALHPHVPAAANAAKTGHAAVVAWDFELRPDI